MSTRKSPQLNAFHGIERALTTHMSTRETPQLDLVLEFVHTPSAAGLKAWQKRLGFKYESAAAALGMSRSAYGRMLAGESGKPVTKKTEIDRRTALACLAIEAGIAPPAQE